MSLGDALFNYDYKSFISNDIFSPLELQDHFKTEIVANFDNWHFTHSLEISDVNNKKIKLIYLKKVNLEDRASNDTCYNEYISKIASQKSQFHLYRGAYFENDNNGYYTIFEFPNAKQYLGPLFEKDTKDTKDTQNQPVYLVPVPNNNDYQSGGKNIDSVFILGRKRKIIIKSGVKYVRYKNNLIKFSDAKKKERSTK